MSIMQMAMLACAVYLIQKDGMFYKVAAGIVTFVAPLAYAIGLWVFAVARSRGTLDLAYAWADSFALPLVTELIIAVATVVAGFLATLIVKGDTRRQTTMAALFGGGAYLVFNVVTPFVTFGVPLPSALLFYGIGGIPYAVALGFAVKLVSMLCLFKSQRLQTGTGSKVWFGICAAATTILLLVQLVSSVADGTLSFFPVLLALAGIAGYVLLLFSRRVGYVIILLAAGIMLLEDFGLNFSGILSVAAGGGNSYFLGEYVSGLFASLLTAVNPTITSIVLLSAWKVTPVPVGSAPMVMATPAPGAPAIAVPAPASAVPTPSFTPAAVAPTPPAAVPSATPAPAPASTPAPKPKPKPKPVQVEKGQKFKPYTGSGVCDVCNKPLGSCKAYIVPNDVFYRSPKYRNYMKNSPLATLFGVPIDDAYFARMQARDQSQGSAVCENCVSMFE
jgi:hypothetical protein